MSEMSVQAYARRLIRARNWHLVQGARADHEREAWATESTRHEAEARRLEREIRVLGFDPQPPMGPRPVGTDAA